jgi:hypothetical protein
MATQTGECQIDKIEGCFVYGWFKSVYEKNVYGPHPGTAAMILTDAFSKLVGREVPEATLRAAIRDVRYETPNSPSTKFTIEVSDPAVLEGLTTGWWESYYVG